MNDLLENIKLNFKKIDQSLVEANLDNLTKEQWTLLSKYVSFDEDFLHKNCKLIDWKVAFKYQYFSIDFIEKKRYFGRPLWKKILTNKKVDEALIEKYWLAEKMPWQFKSDQNWSIFASRQFSKEFIIKHTKQKISTFMYTQKLWEDYIVDNYWLIVASCTKESSSYGSDKLYEDWENFRIKQKHLSNHFFSQFKYRDRKTAYKNLTQKIIEKTPVDKIDWLCFTIYSNINLVTNEKYKEFVINHIVEERLKKKEL